MLWVAYATPDDGQKTCLKHVEFYSKNKFEKLVHLVGFIIRILWKDLIFCWVVVIRQVCSESCSHLHLIQNKWKKARKVQNSYELCYKVSGNYESKKAVYWWHICVCACVCVWHAVLSVSYFLFLNWPVLSSLLRLNVQFLFHVHYFRMKSFNRLFSFQ